MSTTKALGVVYMGRCSVHVRYMSSEVKPCVVWALRVSLPFLAKLTED